MGKSTQDRKSRRCARKRAAMRRPIEMAPVLTPEQAEGRRSSHVRQTTKKERWRAEAKALGERVKMGDLYAVDLDAMCKRYGVRPPMQFEEPEVEEIDLSQFTRNADGHLDMVRCRSRALRTSMGITQFTPRYTGYRPGGIDSQDPTNVPDGQRGTVGTPVYGGLIGAEPVARLQPYIARGFAGSTAHYDRTLLEPTAYKDYQSIREMLVTGVWSWQIPSETPDHMMEPLRECLDECWAMIKGAEPGWPQLVEAAATCVGYGVSMHEIVWDQASETCAPRPVKFGFMEASTIQFWLFDRFQREWIGTKFQSGGSAPLSWVLPSTGPRTQDHRILRCTLGGKGNNLEGIPPTRVIDVLVTMKQLFLRIAAATGERYGCPILVLRTDPAVYKERKLQPNNDEMAAAFEVIEYMAAMDTPAVQLPVGAILEYIGTHGTMPDLLPMLQYLDTAIHSTFSAQAQALSHGSSHGSNALAEVQDNDFLRSIPYYARTIARPFNKIMRLMLRDRGIYLDVYPELKWSAPEEVDPTAWLETLDTLAGLRSQLSEAAMTTALERLGMPADAFLPHVEKMSPEELARRSEVARATVIDYHAGSLPRESAIAILQFMLGKPRDQAAAMVGEKKELVP